jgi:hypothetical protein
LIIALNISANQIQSWLISQSYIELQKNALKIRQRIDAYADACIILTILEHGSHS